MNIQTIAPGIHYIADFVTAPDVVFADVIEQVEFVQREARLYGKLRKVPRLEAWYGPHDYSFGGGSFPARALPAVLLALRVRLECTLERETFESCLANLYRDGSDSVAFHADDEPELGPDPLVACISLGAERDFLLRRKPEDRESARVARLAGAPWAAPDNLKISLEHGSLLVMQRGVQATWLHSLPKRPRCKQARVSLTFRA